MWNMMKIKLTQGKFALIDDLDYVSVSKHSWCYNAGYAKCRWLSQSWTMQRFLLGNAPVGQTIDHINGDKLDNRRSNLRICTKGQNNCNTFLRKDNKSGYKGVSQIKLKHSTKWLASIRDNGKKCYLGYFSTPSEAAMAYNRVARTLQGEYARLNVWEVKDD